MTRYVLGVDGGGTKTQVVILNDEGRVCGTGTSGSSNYDDLGAEGAQRNLQIAVEAAAQQAGVPPTGFDSVFLGMAGVVSAHDQSVIHRIAQNLKLAPREFVGVDHDCRTALAGGLSGRPGIVLITGTGSSCYGRNAAGEDWRAGGWGHWISDEGSGYWFGIQAMTAAVGAYDGRKPETVLVERVKQALGIHEMNDIMHRIYVPGLTRAEIAALGPLVLDAAQDGDSVSLALIDQGAADLAECVLAVARRLGFTDGNCELALVGGLYQSDLFLQVLSQAVHERLPQCRITLAELSPALGACLLALQRLGVEVKHIGQL